MNGTSSSSSLPLQNVQLQTVVVDGCLNAMDGSTSQYTLVSTISLTLTWCVSILQSNHVLNVQSPNVHTHAQTALKTEKLLLFILLEQFTTCPHPKMTSHPPGFSAGLQIEFINPIFEFSKGMNDLHLDEAEYALLIAINIFSAGQSIAHMQDTCTTNQRTVVLWI